MTESAAGSSEAERLTSPARLAALHQAGLSAAADEGMDRFARLVSSVLGVPVALVSLVEPGRQVFPGMVGLAEPWATMRATPLSHSLCQHVVTSERPLVLADVRSDELTCTSLAIEDLGVVAYAGLPLTDGQGHVLGSLCAIDSRPRTWSAQELGYLSDMAAACSADLRLRIVTEEARQARDEAQRAMQAAKQSDLQARAHADRAGRALEQAELMLRAAEDLADTSGIVEVRRRLRSLVSSSLKPSYVGLALVDGQQLRRVPDPDISHASEARTAVFPLDSPFPSAHAVRTREMVVVTDRNALSPEYRKAGIEFDSEGLRAAACVPLTSAVQVLGVLILGWEDPHEIDVTERAVLTAVAGYAARAVERAQHLDQRVTVARELQQAMLTSLPSHPGLELAASYYPVADGELVGGDWYDAYPLAAPSGGQGLTPGLAFTVGDITGHDMKAAAIMGQVRSMMRQADLHDGLSPAGVVTAVERVCGRLALKVSGTLVHAHLTPVPGSARNWSLTWTNAGHLPPLLSHQGAAAGQLDHHDMLLWPGPRDNHRTDRQQILVPGDTLLLYTDGLIERRGQDIDAAISRVAELLSTAPDGSPLTELLRQIADVAGADAEDDVVLFAVRISEIP